MRILHLPNLVAGNAWELSRAERKLGFQSDVLSQNEAHFGYPADITLNVKRLNCISFLKKLLVFLKIRNSYDVFHFNFGQSLLHYPNFSFLYHMELPFYPKNSKLFVTYNGCDARQKYPTMLRNTFAACHQNFCYGGCCNSGQKDEERRKGISIMSRYVKHMWALNPDLLYFLPKDKSSFLPYTVCHFDELIKKRGLSFQNRRLKIVHSPSEPVAKGTSFIVTALERIKRKYPDLIEWHIVQKMSYKKALEIYRTADIVIDQILIGWYGAFAVEAMLMGKPVVVRIEEKDLHLVPKEMSKELMQAIIPANPKNIFSVLENLIHQREILKQKAEAGLEYAMKWHHPSFVASLTKEKYEED